ncbi:hypothetical protein cypCar_00038213, partial [Cyprinus carpio]
MVENIGKLPVPVNVSFLFPVKMALGFSLSVSVPETNGTSTTCENQVSSTNGKISILTHVRIISWAFLSFDTERYIQYPSDDSQQLSIVTELEVPSQALAVLIASLSVIFGLIAMTIIFVLLYK